MTLLDQLILRLLISCLEYPGVVFLEVLQRLRYRKCGLVTYPLFEQFRIESQKVFGLADRGLNVVVLQVVLAAGEDRVDGATGLVQFSRDGRAFRSYQG